MAPTFCFKTSDGHGPHNMLWRLSMVVAVVAVFQISASTASAQFVISQAAGMDYIVFEAEDFDTVTNADPTTGLQIVHTADGICPQRFAGEPFCIDSVDPPPSGLSAGVIELDSGSFVLGPLADNDNPPSDQNGGAAVFDADEGNDQDFLTYKLRFAEQGEYVVYMHYTMFDTDGDGAYGNNDSVFISREFGFSPQGPRGDNNYWASTPTTPGIPPADGPATEGNFHWWRADKRDDDPDGVGVFIVDGSNVSTELDWGVAAREVGITIDKWVLSTDPDLTGDELDALVGRLPGSPPLPGDFNSDGVVNLDDFNILLDTFNRPFAGGRVGPGADIDFSGTVDLRDFLEFRLAFAEAQPRGAASVPEPLAGFLAMLGAAAALHFARRRRHR